MNSLEVVYPYDLKLCRFLSADPSYTSAVIPLYINKDKIVPCPIPLTLINDIQNASNDANARQIQKMIDYYTNFSLIRK